MANPAPTINQINAFNATQGTTIDFNIIGGTELVRSNRIYIYDLSDNSLICTHLYVSTESIHELPPNTDASMVYESGKSSADFVNGKQYYAQIQTFTDIGGTEGGSGLSVAKMFWCLVDPTLTITAIPSTISTTSYNVSATYDANTSVVSNIIQQYQFSLYSATGSLLQSSGVVVGNGEQQGTSTTYDISYNFTGLSVGSSYYVVVDVTTTQGMSVSTQSNTFTVSIDTPTLGEATVVNNACDGYISVTSNLSGEYGGSGSGEIVSFETDSENVFTKLQVDLEPVQDLNGYEYPWVGGAGKNKANIDGATNLLGMALSNGVLANTLTDRKNKLALYVATYKESTLVERLISVAYSPSVGRYSGKYTINNADFDRIRIWHSGSTQDLSAFIPCSVPTTGDYMLSINFLGVSPNVVGGFSFNEVQFEAGLTATSYEPYSNICPISGHDEVVTHRTGVNVWDEEWELGYYNVTTGEPATSSQNLRSKNFISVVPNTPYYVKIPTGYIAICEYDADKNFIKCTQGIINSGITTTANTHFIRFHCTSAYGTTYNNDISINYPSTDHDYHEYNGQTIIQDFNVTLTPTVIDETPYLFKQTGDVRGDRESLELVGGTVAWNQLVQNGDFASSSGWSGNRASVSVASNKCTLTVEDNINSAALRNSTLNGVANHKIFCSMTVTPSKATTCAFFVGGGNTAARPISVSANTRTMVADIVIPTTGTGGAYFYCNRGGALGANDTCIYENVFISDLTAMFGSTIADYIYSLEQATAGAGVAWFKKLFPKPYYEYNAGQLLSVEDISSHDMTGFNQWDEELEIGSLNNDTGEPTVTSNSLRSKNFIKVLPDTTYHVVLTNPPAGGSTITRWFIYDGDKNLISKTSWVNETNITMPSNARYVKFKITDAYGTTYNHDICINISDPSRNGEYEPYTKHTYPLDNSLTLRGIPKLDASNNLYYDGDTYESDGTVTRKYGIVDLGTLNWTYDNTSYAYGFFTSSALSTRKAGSLANAICSKYAVNSGGRYSLGGGTGQIASFNETNANAVCVRDDRYTDVTAFKTAMSGIYLVYPLATPTTETAEPFESIQKVTPNYGTEEFVTDSIVPVGNNTQYYTRDVFGGTLDLVTGVLTVDRVLVTLDGTQPIRWEDWRHFDNDTSAWLYGQDIFPIANSNDIVCDKLATVGYVEIYSGNIGISRVQTSTSYSFGVRVPVAGLTTVSAINAYLTENPIEVVYPLAQPQTYQLTPQQIQTLVGVNNVWSEQGDIELSYHIPITNLLVKRQDVDDVSGTWLTLYSQPITQASDMDFTFIDFLNQYGKTYKYALVPLLTQTQSGVEVEVEGGYTVSDEVQSIFDGVFIADATELQKCKANVGYGDVDMNQAVGTITPIGAKYPVVITNSKNQYHNGSITGTIVPDDYYFNGNLSRIDMVNKRNELEQFLTNKRAKIIKDWNSNIWLVMIMDNVTCTFNNEYGMGIVNFNANWIEVGDPTNQQDLQATGLIDVGGV